MKENEGVAVPKRLTGKEIVNCPISRGQRGVTTVDFCKNECRMFIKFTETQEDGTRGIECSYPRTIEIISVYGREDVKSSG